MDNKAGTTKMTNAGCAFAPNPEGQIPEVTVTPITDKFERIAQTQVLVKAELADYQRAMNWAEAVYPNILTALDKQELGEVTYQDKVFKTRYYPLTKTYVGYNAGDKRIYVYNPAMFGNNPLQLDELSKYLTQAQQAGF